MTRATLYGIAGIICAGAGVALAAYGWAWFALLAGFCAGSFGGAIAVRG